MDKFLDEVYELIESEEFKKAIERLEEFVGENTWIFENATKEELASYDVIELLPEEDYEKLLINIVKFLGESLTKEEKNDTLKMPREMLKIVLILQWIERVDYKEEK